MQTSKITRNWALAGAVAAMLTASTATVQAQDAPAPAATTAPTNPTTPPDTSVTGVTTPAPPAPTDSSATSATTAPMTTMPAPMPADSMTGAMPMGTPDYHILSNPLYDYIDLQQAKARGLSDSQIATIAKISGQTGMPFRTVSAAVERGETFPMLAGQYNLKLADVYSNEKQKQQIADYISTYESIGTKNGSSSGSMMMDTPPMDKPMTMDKPATPDTTTPAPMAATPTDTATAPMATMDIVDTAMAAKNLTTLVKALQVAGLVDTLKGAGPFTVFAPDNKAFSRLPAGTLDALEADPAKLKMVLTYHVIPASVDAATAMSMTSPTSPPTVEGSTLQVTKARHGKLKINDATVTKADIHASNGIIHIIDRVLLPPMDASGNIIPAGAASTDTTGTMTPAAPGTMTPAAPAAPDTTTPATPATPGTMTPPAAPAAPAQ